MATQPKLKKYAVVTFLLAVGGAKAASNRVPDDGSSWWSHVAALADDGMEGRNAGSPGHHRAAKYIADKFKHAGLKPGGVGGYLQPIAFNSIRMVEEESSLELIRNGVAQKLTLGKEAYMSSRVRPAPTVDAPMVFIGYGLQVPEFKRDDLAGLDLKGKIAVYLATGPAGLPGAISAHAQSAAERWKTLNAAGAVGTASISIAGAESIPWARSSQARLQPSMYLTAPGFNDQLGHTIAITINRDHADMFFEGSGHTWAEIAAAHRAGKPLPTFPLTCSIRAKAKTETKPVKSENVVAVLAGSDPRLKKEIVVLSAHMDHLGVNPALKDDPIFNGAMDNASGVAALLEIAARFGSASSRPKRTIVFAAVTGEEKGLLGSRYFANHPSVKGTIVADLNMDMFMPIHKLESVVVLGIEESTLAGAIEQSASEAGLKLLPDPAPQQRRFIRSDQYSFIMAGIPSAAFKFGYEKGSPEEKLQTEWLAKRYHAPSDDLSQPVDKAGAARFCDFLGRAAELVANQPERPHWREESFFKRFERHK